eukprot:CAMPEP_0119114060 /NCGR_PEP_ID=MMETSP1180-20130426/46042_1 /TAXON_ID=3052 ORGANISM="Chlamydomonas cf sp, Strain CCMP681" /NCGR_SAMPLE_ID=MMETSP1180 /ASSEMBLY_ACC=CAM_ASM_000741 /LENGTH=67 /DNA_ID=CAMNT_0007102409 /DNA_START=355 /DNA_END=558 /DNA_ORIENTATION=-
MQHLPEKVNSPGMYAMPRPRQRSRVSVNSSSCCHAVLPWHSSHSTTAKEYTSADLAAQARCKTSGAM